MVEGPQLKARDRGGDAWPVCLLFGVRSSSHCDVVAVEAGGKEQGQLEMKERKGGW